MGTSEHRNFRLRLIVRLSVRLSVRLRVRLRRVHKATLFVDHKNIGTAAEINSPARLNYVSVKNLTMSCRIAPTIPMCLKSRQL